MSYQLLCGDCLEELKKLPDNSLDSCVTDPPYHLVSIVKRFGAENAAPAKSGKTGAYARASKGFMGKTWDGGDIAFQADLWREVWRVLKPGAHLAAMGATRGYHRMACAIEDAGFEIRDSLMWIYGTGFPKSYDTAQCIEKLLTTGKSRRPDRDLGGLSRDRFSGDVEGGLISNTGGKVPLTTEEAKHFSGFGTALKPAFEPIVLARKPLSEKTVAANVLKWGTGAINIDGCRVASEGGKERVGEKSQDRRYTKKGSTNFAKKPGPRGGGVNGRWPANIITDGSDEVSGLFPLSAGQQGDLKSTGQARPTKTAYGNMAPPLPHKARNDTGSAARFFYSAKASKHDRADSKHPTVKPIALMQYLVRLITPPNGTVLDPFAGTGTTGAAATREGMRSILIEKEKEYQDDIRRRMEKA